MTTALLRPPPRTPYHDMRLPRPPLSMTSRSLTRLHIAFASSPTTTLIRRLPHGIAMADLKLVAHEVVDDVEDAEDVENVENVEDNFYCLWNRT